MRFDPTTSHCRILTRRRGVLSSFGHDLELEPSRFVIEVDETSLAIDAHFAADSLRVVGASKGGESSEVSDHDRKTIEGNIRDVLHSERHRDIVFRSSKVEPSAGGFVVSGALTLNGRTRELSFATRPHGEEQVAEITLHQPDWGIKPYSAFLGALELRPEVTVRVALAWPGREGAGQKR